jgi:hypothetical protein
MEDEESACVKSLDSSVYELHYSNGYIDTKTGDFHKRNSYFDPPAVNACFLAAKEADNTLFSCLGQFTN